MIRSRSSLWIFFFLFIVVVQLNCVDASFPIHRVKRASDNPTIKGGKWNVTKADQLKRKLLTYYDKFTRPSLNGSATLVFLDPTIHHIELDEEKSIMTVHCWIKMVWQDESLKWNISDYDGLSELHLADHEIWQPDLVPYNSAAGSSLDHFGNSHAIVSNDGTVIWVPPAIIQVFCDLNLKKWPFDTQVCNIKIGSWTYSGMQIDLNYKDEVELSNILPNAEWQFVSMTRKRNVVTYPCCAEPYIDLEFTVTIKRESPTYRALIITPISAIVFMTLSIFWLPTASGDKITLAGVTSVIVCMFLLYFSQKVAVMAGHTPLIVYFYTGTLQLLAISVIISVVVIKLARNRRMHPLPWFIKVHLTGWLGTWLFLEKYATQPYLVGASFHIQYMTKSLSLQHCLGKSRVSGRSEDESTDIRPVLAEAQEADLPEGQQIEGGNPSGSGRNASNPYYDDWLLFAAAIDRISLIIYCVLFIAFSIAYST